MMEKGFGRWLLCLVVVCAVSVRGEIRLPAVISDNMVWQQDRPVTIWGWAEAGEPVVVSCADQRVAAVADEQGAWRVTLAALVPGEPLEMTVASGREGGNAIVVRNILVGEVWLCSGQSNMQWAVAGSRDAEAEIRNARHPRIRLFQVNRDSVVEPGTECRGAWVECSPVSVGGFSAVGYYFGRQLHQEMGYPVGLVQAAVGGTPVESWISQEALRADPELAIFIERKAQILKEHPAAQAKYEVALAEHQRTGGVDAQSRRDDTGWETVDFDDSAWREMSLPQQWELAGLDMDGVVWFRREAVIPEGWAGRDLAMTFGPIDDQDVTFFNGVQVGATGTETPQAWLKPRRYVVPGELVRAGRAVIAVKNTDMGGIGGILGKPEEMTLGPADGGDRLALAGPWRYEVAAVIMRRPNPPLGPGHGWLPTGLYNGMIAPLTSHAIRGVIWYQGESNAGRAYQYRRLFPALITDWRRQWGIGDFPFLFVQLANFMAAKPLPGDSDWAELREAQTMALALPATGMAVTIDIGEADDIHPRNKQDVGVRLARWALAKTYGRDVVHSGPLYEAMSREGSRIRLRFAHVGGGLMAVGDGKLKGFAIAGADRKFVWAEATIDGDTVVVSSPQVPKPVAVRYAWANNPEGCNLFNREGLPASPFRTDDWPGITVNRR